ncbi:S-DNA-T family DNA segregation ATPase FtsK/SpoIIIE [Prauserella shujinwangii]|uniref:S-DNA-T family DNA segregation ATPase FtsK/SpoIIIE n=1 Tax=Prauserella shujinwangii TaxID=1453103 RepID=A0A2T0LUQ9_9PSEU|nr:FtsK/SpoIIIE domain-containing protein [Prauserella shujinwangii]PRX47564.1 S-DNA-T family DNA segregation ATPase FtsK/SpoIIIE [Prauserella shujinwangii]
MSWRDGLTLDRNAGWQEVHVATASARPDGAGAWALWLTGRLLAGVRWLLMLVAGFVVLNPVVAAAALPAAWLYLADRPWWALAALLVTVAGFGAWFWLRADAFDARVTSPLRKWWRRRRYVRKWSNLMASSGLAVKTRRHQVLAPRLVWVRQGRYADVLRVRLPDGITAARFTERLPEITEALRAREARVLPARRWRLPAWLRARLPREFAPADTRPGTVFLRLAFGDPLVHVVTQPAPAEEIDLSAVTVGRRDDGQPWRVSLLGTHTLLAGATGSGKGSVLWSLIAALGPAIRSGLVHVVGLDPKGGMELGFGRELFRALVTMDGRDAEDQAVAFLEDLADEADRRASMLAGHARTLTPTVDMPFLLIVIDELASVTAFIADSKRRQRAEAALGRLLTKGRAPGMHVVGALQDPRKEVVKWRDLFPTRIALRLVEDSQVDMVLGDGARSRGARCEAIAETAPGVGYVVEDGSRAVTRVRAAYLTDDDIRQLARDYRPGPVLHAIDGGVA